MGFVRAIVLTVVALVGLVVGAVAFLGLGLFAVSPPTISQAAPRQPWDVSLDITDTFLTAQLNRPRTDQTVQLSDARATMRADGTISITGNAGTGSRTAAPSAGGRPPINPSGIAIPVEIVLRPSVGTDGKLTVEVVRAQFGPLPVPAQLGSLLEGPVNEQLTNALNGQPFAITELTVRDGAMLVRAKQVTP